MKLPKVITQDLYYYKPSCEIIKEHDLVKFKENKEKKFIEQAELNRKIALDKELEDSLYKIMIYDFVRKYLDNSYIINKINNKEEKLDEKLDEKDNTNVEMYIPEYSKDTIEDIRPIFQEFCRQGNKILRALKKTRKNDYLDFYKMLKDNYHKKEDIKEQLDELEEAILNISKDDEDDKKLNKLEILLQNTYASLESKAMTLIKPKVSQYVDEYNEKNKEKNISRMTNYIKSYKSAHMKDFRYDLEHNLINIFDEIISFRRRHINFLDDGERIALITDFDLSNKKLKLTSGRSFSKYNYNIIQFNMSDEDYLVTYGDTFTYVCKDKII